MDRNQRDHDLENGAPYSSREGYAEGPPNTVPHELDAPHAAGPTPYATSTPSSVFPPPPNSRPAGKFESLRPKKLLSQAQELSKQKINKKWQRRLYWMVPLGILAIVLSVLFEVYKSDFERWVEPLTDWMRKNEAWSWTIPVAILLILSFPPLFGHEIVQLIVGLTYPLGVAMGIACAGAVLGEAACFLVFKYFFSDYVERKIAADIKWAAITRVTQEAGFRGVLVIRYSIVPPHLANPLFSCTGMKFWLYMTTVILSLPKSLVFVALGSPGSENSKAAKWGKVVAIGVVVIVTIFASIWIRKKLIIATAEIKSERGITNGDGDYELLNPHTQASDADDTSYHGASNAPSIAPYSTQARPELPTTRPFSYEGDLGVQSNAQSSYAGGGQIR